MTRLILLALLVCIALVYAARGVSWIAYRRPRLVFAPHTGHHVRRMT